MSENENAIAAHTADESAATDQSQSNAPHDAPAAVEAASTEAAAEATAEASTEATVEASTEDISYHAVEKDGQVTAIWEMQGRKHLRTIDPRSRQGQDILRLYTSEHHDEAGHAATEPTPATATEPTAATATESTGA
ncbi:MAG: hypothetical protein ACR2LC_14235 [Pyrinomonadaceae bacterium]